MKRKFLIIVMLLTIGINGYSDIALADTIVNRQMLTSTTITPFADITEWFYKVEGGKLYKRLYNSTEGNWIGPWILVS
jgi:hypothetical protein